MRSIILLLLLAATVVAQPKYSAKPYCTATRKTNCSPVAIAAGAKALATAEIASATCTAAQTAVATGVSSADVIAFTPNADITGVTGYAPAATGGLTVLAYPTANTVNFKVCNWTALPITPGAVTLNWRVVR